MPAFDFHYYGVLYREKLELLSIATGANDTDGINCAVYGCRQVIDDMCAAYDDHVNGAQNPTSYRHSVLTHRKKRPVFGKMLIDAARGMK